MKEQLEQKRIFNTTSFLDYLKYKNIIEMNPNVMMFIQEIIYLR